MSDAVPHKPLIDPTVTLGAAIQIAVLLLGGLTFLLTNSSRTENTAEQVKRLEGQVAQQATQTRDSIRESVSRVEVVVANLQTQVGALPTMAERMRQLDNQVLRLEERDGQLQRYLDDRRGQLDARFQALEQRAIEMRSQLDGMQRASGVSLPGSPGRR